MKRKQIVLSLFALAVLMALPAWGIPIIIDAEDYMSQLGVRFGSAKVTMAEGQTLTATVGLPAVLARHGLKAKEGEAVQVTYLRDHRFKLMHVPSGASVEITYRPKK
ncbi:MAG TPA: hypothetical protein PKJ41_06780 [Bryobacteraceae bacterium]|nr:hypothetical protein [Bryobacteraceae bacterium]HPT25686.1 hypothetical protein [Bryobacteraceae bacterium]